MFRTFGMAAVLLLFAHPVWANGDIVKTKESVCVQMVKMPCTAPIQAPIASAPAPRVHPTVVCKTECLSDEAWAKCKTKSWYASSKVKPHAKPGDPHASDRFYAQCGTACRLAGFPKLGYRSHETGQWTVFRFGHKDD